LDIDQDILAAVERINGIKGKNNIHTFVNDVRKNIRPELKGAFDVVITDPPYTKSGITLFLNRAIQLLGNTDSAEGKYIFLYYGNSFKSPEKSLKIQEVINRFNLLVEDKIEKFARYSGAESIGNASSLYILKATKFTKPIDETELSVPIYTFENQKEEKFPFVSHVVAKVYGVPDSIINSRSYMLKFLGQFCELHRLKVVDKKETRFKGNGFSFTFILSSSNLLAHTWPEHNAIHIDLVTCAPIAGKEALGANLLKLFQAKNVEIREIE
jgi:S-adenosylmethionine/arginine decarboxylase-like enzyme/predicted RNA methylase